MAYKKTRTGKKKLLRRCLSCGNAVSNLAFCDECHKLYCYPCLITGQWKKDMGEDERLREVCNECIRKFGYERA